MSFRDDISGAIEELENELAIGGEEIGEDYAVEDASSNGDRQHSGQCRQHEPRSQGRLLLQDHPA